MPILRVFQDMIIPSFRLYAAISDRRRRAMNRKPCDILVVARMSPRRESRTRRLLRALSPNFSVLVVAESPGEEARRAASVDGAELREVALPYPRFGAWHLGGLLRVLYLNLHGVAIALREHPRAVVCSDALYCLPGIFAKLILHRRFVYNSHEIMWGLGNPRLLNALLGMLEKIAIQLCDFWLVPSEERAMIILRKHRLERRYVVYENFPLIDAQESTRAAPDKTVEAIRQAHTRPIVMFQGSLDPERGLDELIQSAQSGTFHLIIQGAGSLAEEIRRRTGSNVSLQEACPNNATVRWLGLADLSFVYYKNNCLNSAYACSNKFYASVFAGVPVICNRLPALEAFAGRYGGVEFFDALEPRAIEDCIARALAPERYSRLKREILRARQALESTSLEGRISSAFGQLFAADPI